MLPRKIAILGGGMASLSAAFQLTRTDALRQRHEVTVYQIGWRLGGKGATGRQDGRILEHGLHIWFGFYDNAFRLLRDVFRDWQRPADHPLQSWRDAFQPQSFTPVGPGHFPLNWPTNDAVPGDGHLLWTPWQAFTEVLGFLAAAASTWHEEQGVRAPASPVAVPARVTAQLAESGAVTKLRGGGFSHAHHALQAAESWARALGDSHHGDLRHHLPGIAELVGHAHQGLVAAAPGAGIDADRDLLLELLDIARGFTRGFVHDFMIDGRTAREVDATEFRDWLVAHGTTPAVAAQSFITRALYDTMFQYVDGDLAQPSYAAGTAVQVILRLFGTSKGAALWEMQAGMGEVVVLPLYQLLKSRGVRFRFFREVERLALDPSRRRVAQIHLARQADTLAGDYAPTFQSSGLDCWPAQPFWDQLKDGPALQAAGVDFESPWSPHQPAGHEVLQQGVDFDEVVLGICLGAFKKLNDDATLADELTAAHPAFKSMTEQLSLLPSMALQLWCKPTLAELGWQDPKPACVAGVEPLDIWADMSQTLAYESHAVTPGSVHYFTGVMNSQAFRQPRSAHGTQQLADAELTRICQHWLSTQAPRIWPRAVTASGSFDWSVLASDSPLVGEERIATQYVRANVSPAECCVMSAAGKTRYRLRADASGFDNLKLAGTWIDTGFNTECIEAAVMSGMQAARALCGEPVHVIAEDLLQTPGHGLGAAAGPLQLMAAVGEAVECGVERLGRWLHAGTGSAAAGDRK